MPHCCCVPGCTNYRLTRALGVPLHRFPMDDTLRRTWLVRVKNAALPVHATYKAVENYRVCGKHFLPSDYERDLYAELMKIPAKQRLKKDAIPSVLIPGSAPSPPPRSAFLKREASRAVASTVTGASGGTSSTVTRASERTPERAIPGTSSDSPCAVFSSPEPQSSPAEILSSGSDYSRAQFDTQ